MKKLERLLVVLIYRFLAVLYLIFAVFTGMIGNQIYHSADYGILDFFLAPLAWIWWFCYNEVNITIIKQTFAFFFQ